MRWATVKTVSGIFLLIELNDTKAPKLAAALLAQICRSVLFGALHSRVYQSGKNFGCFALGAVHWCCRQMVCDLVVHGGNGCLAALVVGRLGRRLVFDATTLFTVLNLRVLCSEWDGQRGCGLTGGTYFREMALTGQRTHRQCLFETYRDNKARLWSHIVPQCCRNNWLDWQVANALGSFTPSEVCMV
ncbi:unnamed protein product [Ostreobium quekettii]|uniref:Uncharacterized protein n=1 Tax=Ostreobium quekettii TaxID=121088 RepID=A0A8S1J2W7_9CHLO|nr:unnamed protein product [Ostreobium quekettii]